MPLPFSSEDAILLAACPVCCSFRKEPCRFNRTEDPEGVRAWRRQSHAERTIKARKIFDDLHALPVDIPGVRV